MGEILQAVLGGLLALLAVFLMAWFALFPDPPRKREREHVPSSLPAAPIVPTRLDTVYRALGLLLGAGMIFVNAYVFIANSTAATALDTASAATASCAGGCMGVIVFDRRWRRPAFQVGSVTIVFQFVLRHLVGPVLVLCGLGRPFVDPQDFGEPWFHLGLIGVAAFVAVIVVLLKRWKMVDPTGPTAD